MITSCSNQYTPDEAFRTALEPIGLDDTVPAGKLTATFLGNTTIYLSDGRTHLLVDGFLTRPSLPRSIFGKIGPDRAKISAALETAHIRKIDAVLVGHAHADHAPDAPTVVEMHPGAILMGSPSVEMVAKGHSSKVAEDMAVVRSHGDSRPFGDFTVTFVKSGHVEYGPIAKRLVKNEGNITKPVGLRARATDYKCGPVYAIHISHPGGKILVQTSAGKSGDILKNFPADVTFLGIGLAGANHITSEDRRQLYRETVADPKSSLVIPCHWDNFWRPLKRPLPQQLRLLDKINVTMSELKGHAQKDGVKIWWPKAFERIALP